VLQSFGTEVWPRAGLHHRFSCVGSWGGEGGYTAAENRGMIPASNVVELWWCWGSAACIYILAAAVWYQLCTRVQYACHTLFRQYQKLGAKHITLSSGASLLQLVLNSMARFDTCLISFCSWIFHSAAGCVGLRGSRQQPRASHVPVSGHVVQLLLSCVTEQL
jgi:hypothetical protein